MWMRPPGPTDAAFFRFVEVHWRQLLGMARLLAGADAEDLLQGVLVRCYPRWRRIEQDDPVGYVRRALVTRPLVAGGAAHVPTW